MAWNNSNRTAISDVEIEDSFEINPSVYANRIIGGVIDAPIKALEGNKTFNEGLYAYVMGIQTLELLCRANLWIGGVGDDYDKILVERIASIKTEIDAEKIPVRRDAKISKIKFELLLQRILETRTKEAAMRV